MEDHNEGLSNSPLDRHSLPLTEDPLRPVQRSPHWLGSTWHGKASTEHNPAGRDTNVG